MDTRSLTTQANILAQLNQHQTFSSTIAEIPVAKVPQSCGTEATLLQAKLDQIAEAPKNLGHGCGVALGKAINKTRNFCNALRAHMPSTDRSILDYLWSEFPLFQMVEDQNKNLEDAQMVNECYARVAELENALRP